MAASDARVQPVARFGVMRRISTLSASPGLGAVDEDRAVHRVGARRAARRPCRSRQASIVSVITVSPEATVSAAGQRASTLCQWVATKRCVVIECVLVVARGNGSARCHVRLNARSCTRLASQSAYSAPCRQPRSSPCRLVSKPRRGGMNEMMRAAPVLAPADVEGGEVREELEFVIGQVVMDPPGQRFPVAGRLVVGDQRWTMIEAVAPMSPLASRRSQMWPRKIGLVASAVELVLVAEAVDRDRPEGRADRDAAEAAPSAAPASPRRAACRP